MYCFTPKVLYSRVGGGGGGVLCHRTTATDGEERHLPPPTGSFIIYSIISLKK